MKRILPVVFALLFCISFPACDQESNEPQNDIPTESVAEYSEKFCSVEKAKAFITTADITLENWEEYFEIKEIEAMKKDPLGEETGYKEMDWYVGFKKTDWAINETVTLKFTYKEATKMEYTNQVTNQVRIEDRNDGTDFEDREDFVSISSSDTLPKWYKDVMYEWDWWCEENEVNKTTMIIQDFKCEGVKGSVGKCTIPDDAWNVSESGTRYLLIGTPEGCTRVDGNENLFRNLKNAISIFS